MQTTEAIVVATLTALMTSVGIKVLSPEASELAEVVLGAARTQDKMFEHYEEITGYKWYPVQSQEAIEAARLVAQKLADLKSEQDASGSDGSGLEAVEVGSGSDTAVSIDPPVDVSQVVIQPPATAGVAE